MKKLLGVSALGLFILLSTLNVSLTSCTKEKIVIDTLTVIKKDTLVQTDTVIIKDTALSLQILTANSWELQEYKGVVGNSTVFYERGGSDNTNNFDNEYITFNENKTGLYTDAFGGQYSFTWDFANADNTKIVWIYNRPQGPLTVTWDNIRYKNASLTLDQYWTDEDVNSHTQIIRIPKH